MNPRACPICGKDTLRKYGDACLHKFGKYYIAYACDFTGRGRTAVSEWRLSPYFKGGVWLDILVVNKIIALDEKRIQQLLLLK